ncbi:AfsA-related hotdog domain-containing protein [Paraburkholderia sp. MM5482-R1]|uniref:AfsA-related hotdog domain-containing protein n=1 Tax=unclassified Paraburkholderia TaxID=2615204 RepID=UPI003D1FECC3
MELLAITPNLLHKDSQDDVLVRCVKDTPSVRLTARQWDELVANASQEEHELLDNVYIPEGTGRILKDVPAQISAADAMRLNGFEIDLSSFYSLDGDRWRLTATILPLGVIRLLQRLGSAIHSPIVDDAKLAKLRVLLSTHLAPGLAPTFSYLAHNDTGNYFFYRKMHEHVPGLMLIEIARQAMYHYVYSTTGFHRGEVSISMSNLDISFDRYVESAYELEILVSQSDRLMRNQPRVIDKTASFFQNGRPVARIRLQGTIMKLPLFKRLRTLSFPETHWFTLSHRVSPTGLLTDRTGGVYPVKIEQLSMVGVRLTHPPRNGAYAGLGIHVQGDGFIVLPLSKRNDDAQGSAVEFSFAALDARQRYALQELIKCNGFFNGSSTQLDSPEYAFPQTLQQQRKQLRENG